MRQTLDFIQNRLGNFQSIDETVTSHFTNFYTQFWNISKRDNNSAKWPILEGVANNVSIQNIPLHLTQ